VKLFELDDKDQDEMIVFMDTKHLDSLKSILTTSCKIKLIPIDREWMNKLPMWRTLSRETDIMKSVNFLNLVPDYRKNKPEVLYPEYTLINHCKIDLICYVIENNMTSNDYLAWVDFGYFKISDNIPNKLLDIEKFHKDRINYTILNPISEAEKDPIFVLQQALENIAGYMFLGRKDILLKYQKVYHNALHYYQYTLGIADDDQALALYCCWQNPDLFHFFYIPKWHKGLVMLQKS
jgi:hypothetical protein